MRKKTAMRFEVTHHLPGHDTPTHTLTDAAGVTTLLQQAASAGDRLHIRPWPRSETPDSRCSSRRARSLPR
jgi:hypothetical protein